MQIDWFTVAAQLFNFLLLAWLLKRFLYGPVIDAMAERERRIASRLEQAGEREADAQAQAQAYRDKMATLEREREARLAQAHEAAEQERRELVEAARGDARASRERWQRELEREQADFQGTLTRELAEAATDIARRALADLADATLERQALSKLARRVQALPPEQLQALAEAAPRLQLATSFEPAPEALADLRQALAGALGREVELHCVRKPGLVFGAELSGAGHRLDWSLAGHLDDVTEEIRQSIEEAREAASEPTPAVSPRDPGQGSGPPALAAG
jgi:F-type H+-transporting ATPase subunit b